MIPGAGDGELTWAKLQHHVLNKLDENASETKDLKEEVRDLTGKMSALDAKVDRQGDDIRQLLTLVRDGNGKAALLVRQELLEQRVVALEKEKDSRETDTKDRNKSNRMVTISFAVSVCLLVLQIFWSIWKDTQNDLKLAKERSSYSQPYTPEKKNQ